jgi:DinB superfamily
LLYSGVVIKELMLAKWEQVREGLLATIEKFSDAELAYRSSANSYAVGETILHIAHEEDIEINHALTRSPSELPEAYDERNFPDKASIIAVLDEVHGRTLSYLSALGDDDLAAEIETPGDR